MALSRSRIDFIIGLKVEVEVIISRTKWATYRSICKNMEVTVGFKWKLN